MKRNCPSLNSNIALAVLVVSLAGGAEGQKAARDLTEASLEDLMNIEVTTVSKKEQKLSQAPAAIFVITQEDIRRSGMTTIPDLLRMVPGLQVGQMQSGTWAVSARGFNSQASDKMLVMVDGRSIYSPLSKGVFWDQQDTLLEDIDRIEVVRGPGATLWGANAVNGVVNIITKSAVDTQGSLVTAGAGSEGQVLGGLRFGGALGDSGHYRIFSKYSDGNDVSVGQMNLYGTRSLHGGFRADWTLSSRDSLTVEGDLFHASSGEALNIFQLTPPFGNVARSAIQDNGGDLMVNWTRRQSDRSQTALRVSVDHSSGNDPLENSGQSTIDVDFQQQLTLSESNGLVWGLGFRDSF
ncbi:MAG TPA: TonB-dependent receptor plug domain-containing protein, partial [Bryobacteraceae bacterium]|nr:TonB-dependent receptor plug domain-containing protein [Bryobacteraceae bacterium]